MTNSNSNSCEFDDYESLFDQISLDPPSPPLFGSAEYDVLMNNINPPSSSPGDFNFNDVNYKDDVGRADSVGYGYGSNNQKEDVPSIEISSSGDQDDGGKEEKHHQVQNIKKRAAAAATGRRHQEAIDTTIADADADAPSLKRKRASNREASKRVRDKKQAVLAQLEARITKLQLSHASASKFLNDITQKFEGAAEENIALKVRLEELRKHVNIRELALQKAVWESNQRFHFQTGMSSCISGSPPLSSQKIGQLQTSLPGVVAVEDGGVRHHQTIRRDLEIHRLAADKGSVNQHSSTTTSTEFHSLVLPPTAWDDMSWAKRHF